MKLSDIINDNSQQLRSGEITMVNGAGIYEVKDSLGRYHTLRSGSTWPKGSRVYFKGDWIVGPAGDEKPVKVFDV